MRTVEETKAMLNVLIKNDKKHLKFFADKYSEYEEAKNNGGNFYIIVEGRNYIVTNYVELKFKPEKSHQNSPEEVNEKPSFATYFLRLLNAFTNFEDNDCTSWILDHYKYLKNRTNQIYAEDKTCHIYQFKYVKTVKSHPANKFIEL